MAVAIIIILLFLIMGSMGSSSYAEKETLKTTQSNNLEQKYIGKKYRVKNSDYGTIYKCIDAALMQGSFSVKGVVILVSQKGTKIKVHPNELEEVVEW